MSEWQPISTAPDKPGEYIVALDVGMVTHGWFTPDREEYVGNMLISGQWTILDGGPDNDEPDPFVPPEFLNCHVTHWMPLPDPPTEPEA